MPCLRLGMTFARFLSCQAQRGVFIADCFRQVRERLMWHQEFISHFGSAFAFEGLNRFPRVLRSLWEFQVLEAFKDSVDVV